MGLLFSAAEMADLRRKFFTTLSGDELRELATRLDEAVAEVEDGVATAQLTAEDAAAAAAGAATPGYVDSKVAEAVEGRATEDYVDSAVSDKITGAQLAEAIEDLATEGYVDAKFDGAYSSGETDASKVLIDGVYHPVVNGLIMEVVP